MRAGVVAGLWLVAGLAAAPASAQPAPSVDPPRILDVPYLPQSVLLCGGAALAMTERWWGRRGVYSEDFAGLVRPALGGIRTTDLDSAARARGWDARVISGTEEAAKEALRRGAPVIALIEVARDRYHYVVLLGWRDGKVTFHDPAVAPFASLDESQFMARWSGADRWALVVRPMAANVSIGTAPIPEPVDSMPCRPRLDQALDAVAAGRLEEASALLEEARLTCPGEPVVLRELAAVRFKQGRHREAIDLADEYLALVPSDRLAWQLLATSRYLSDDRDGALRAWTRIGAAKVDLVRIDGIRAIRFPAVAAAIGVRYGAVLTPARLTLARRRLSEIPAVRLASVDYQPVAGGILEVRGSIVERPVLGSPWRLAVTGAIRAAAQSEAELEVASAIGAGELWTGGWRWQDARPRALLRLDVPATLGFPGTIGVEGAWERFPFRLDPTTSTLSEESRHSTGIDFGGWVTAGVRPSTGLRLERWSTDRTYLAASIGAEARAAGDRLRVAATVSHAAALTADRSYDRFATQATWASALGLDRAAWSTRVGFDWISDAAPLGSWPIAGGSLDWAIPLRAGSYSRDGFLTGRGAGRRILHGGLAVDHPVLRVGPMIVAGGLFLDGAAVGEGADGVRGNRADLDGGAGVRIGIGDGRFGVIRVDVATGLLDRRRSALSVGVHRSWPPFQPRSR